MFYQLFRFEVIYRLRRPAFYVFFFLMLGFTAWTFGHGMVPAGDKEHINAPAILAMVSGVMSFFLSLMSISFMGVTMYRDIEHGTKEYYFSYPITKAGYFWGRFLGSFLFVAITGAVVMFGAWLGSRLGPAFHWQPAERYGQDRFIYYWQPYWTIILPNLFFTSTIFFGLVSVFRTVKVIYVAAMFLFLGYALANFFLHTSNNMTVIYLADPFTINGMRSQLSGLRVEQLNSSIVPLQGLLLSNRILWMSIGVVVVLLTYGQFSFQHFFKVGGKRKKIAEQPVQRNAYHKPEVSFSRGYLKGTLLNLSRIEILNLVRDSYFWIIVGGGFFFLGFLFFMGPGGFGFPDYPRTVFFMDVFYETFLFFVFLIIVFFTGEAVHRERITRYSLINDTLPPPTWMLNSAKLLALLCLGIFLASTPVWLGLIVQVLKGYTEFNFTQALSSEFVTILPRCIEFVLLCYAIHVAAGNKFLGHGIAITIFCIMWGLTEFNYADYHLLLYSYTPRFWASDMDGLGHMVRPILWYHIYWNLAGWVLVVAAGTFYARGTRTSFREKRALALQRFRGVTRWGLIALIILVLGAGGFIYYNVNYRNEYLTVWEKRERAAIAEKQMKRYDALPLPTLTRVQMNISLFPGEKRAVTHAFCTIKNNTGTPVDSLLIDGGDLDYILKHNGRELSYTCPLYFPRGKFNGFRSKQEAGDYRVYQLPARMDPGDSMIVEVHSEQSFHGFQNDIYAESLLDNVVLSNGNLPSMGYDRDEELKYDDLRKEHGLPERTEVITPADDCVAKMQPGNGFNAGLVSTDITIDVPAGFYAIAPGHLQKQRTSGGRQNFQYVQEGQGAYMPYAIIAARYSLLRDTVMLPNGPPLPTLIAYHPLNDRNIVHFNSALKDGVHYYSTIFGAYPFPSLSLVETPSYGPGYVSLNGVIGMSEPNTGWIADLRKSSGADYPCYNVVHQLARQWWGHEVIGNRTDGALIWGEAIAEYAALRFMERKFGKNAAMPYFDRVRNSYGWKRHMSTGEKPLLNSNESFLLNSKGTLVLYGMAELVGEDSVNLALSELLHRWAFKNGGPYPGAGDLYSALKAHTPDSLQYYLEDSWEKVTLYDNRVTDATVSPAKGGGYTVQIRFNIHKISDNQDIPNLDDIVEIGVFEERTPLRLYRSRFTAGDHTLELHVNQKPTEVRIDPNNILPDVRYEDNRKRF